MLRALELEVETSESFAQYVDVFEQPRREVG